MTAPRPLRPTATVLLCLLLSVPSPAFGQAGWRPPVVLDDLAAWRTVPRVGVDGAGNAIAVWHDEAMGVAARRYDRRAAQWSPPISLGPAFLPFPNYGPEIAVAPDGDAVAVWQDANTGPLFAVRFNATTGTWSPPARLVDSVPSGSLPEARVAVSAGGQAVVTWATVSGDAPQIYASHYRRLSDTWTAGTRVADSTYDMSGLSGLEVAIDPSGNTTLVWQQLAGVSASRHDGASDTWDEPVSLSGPAGSFGYPQVAVDASGNATVVWPQAYRTMASRFHAATGLWAPAVAISPAAHTAEAPHVAASSGGDVVVAWIGRTSVHPRGIVYAARYPAAGTGWTEAESLLPNGRGPTDADVAPRAAIDGLGNAFVAWRRVEGGGSAWSDDYIHVARYSRVAARWEPPWTLPFCAGCLRHPRLSANAAGHAVVVWGEDRGSYAKVHAARWDATPERPRITGILPCAGCLLVQAAASRTTDTAFAPTRYAYSIDDGATWVTPDPPMIAPPVFITGLTDGTTYRVRLRAMNGAGSGAPSIAVNAIPGVVPGPPTDLVVTHMAGNAVTLTWTPPPGLAPAGYVLEGGLGPGETLVRLPSGPGAPPLTMIVPRGVFYVRVAAATGANRLGPPSNEIRLVVDVPTPPTPPEALLSLVNGSEVALSWTPTLEGGAPTGYRLDITGPVSGTQALPAGDRVRFTGVPQGTYTLDLRAINAAGASPPSNALTLVVTGACSGVPGTPTRVMVAQRGRTVTATWGPPESGAAVSDYVISVSGAWTGELAATSRELSGVVGPGTYVVQVAARNSCGRGSPAQTAFTVP